ncbi:MAG: hypothetical protein WDO14_05040 [Bacteroidota bacterium]
MPGFIKGLLNGGKLLEGAKNIIDEIVTTKEEKAQLEIKFKELINQHEQALVNAEVDDRKSAREREVELIRAGHRNLTQNILAYTGIAAFFAITGYIISHGLGGMTTEESFIIGNLTGLAGAIAKDIYGYYFGSSKGEREAYKPLMKSKP